MEATKGTVRQCEVGGPGGAGDALLVPCIFFFSSVFITAFNEVTSSYREGREAKFGIAKTGFICWG